MIARRALIRSAGACLALTAGQVRSQAAEKAFSADDVREDLDTIWSALREVSPDPFRTSRFSQVEAAYERARAGIIAPMTLRSAWAAIAPVLGALDDGHVGLGFDASLNAAAQRFPLHFATTERSDRLLLDHDRTGTIPQGAQIVSIEGRPAAEVLRTTLAAFGGQTRALARWRVTAAGAWTAIALFGARPSYRVRWKEPTGPEREAAIPAGAPAARQAPSEPYSFRWLREGVGLIDYRRCEDPPRFRTPKGAPGRPGRRPRRACERRRRRRGRRRRSGARAHAGPA